MYREWLVESLKKTDRSQADLARATGIAHSVINRMVLGKRPIRDHEIVAISRALGIPPPSKPPGRTYSTGAHPLEVEMVSVVGVAQDGVWRDRMGAAMQPLVSEIPAIPSADFSGVRKAVQLALPLDMSQNVATQYMIFVPIEELGRKLRNDDIVYAEITRDRFVQQTILRVETGAKGLLFRHITPSNDAVWKAKDVKVIGLVTGTHIEYRV